MFPTYVRTIADAIAYVDDWARATGGWRTSGIADQAVREGVAFRQFEIEYADGRVLSVSMTLDAQLVAVYYRFHLTRNGVFVWRLDKHPGHEDEHNGSTHLHVGPLPRDRHPHPPVNLAEVADRLHESAE